MISKLKKFLIYIIFIVILLKLFEIGFSKKTVPTSSDKVKYEKIDYKKFDYGDYTTVRLLHTRKSEK